MWKEEDDLEEEEIRKYIDDEFALDVRNKNFDESEAIEKEEEHDERAEELECENEDSLHRMLMENVCVRRA